MPNTSAMSDDRIDSHPFSQKVRCAANDHDMNYMLVPGRKEAFCGKCDFRVSGAEAEDLFYNG